jgi:hypothetical protein
MDELYCPVGVLALGKTDAILPPLSQSPPFEIEHQEKKIIF